MLHLLFLGILAGIDDLEVAAAVAIGPLTRLRRLQLIAAFAICELVSPLIGIVTAGELRSRFRLSFNGIGPFAVAACGIAIVWFAMREQRDGARRMVNSRWTIIGLPLTLSVDNVLIGFSAATIGDPPVLAALVIGGISAALAVAGILAGERLARLIPERTELVTGLALIVIAASRWIRG